jgi:hypothetical protein
MCVSISPIINYLEVLLIYFETLDLKGKEVTISSRKRDRGEVVILDLDIVQIGEISFQHVGLVAWCDVVDGLFEL